MKRQRIIFMGSPDFSIPCLAEMQANSSLSIEGVFSQPDRAKGRRGTPTPCPVRAWALDNKLPTHTPDNNNEIIRIITEINPDIIVVIAYGRLIPKEIVDNYLCINLHASLLPKYRGASPIQAALLNGDTETGVSVMRMNEGLDEGDVISIHNTKITDTDNAGSLHDTLAELSKAALMDFLSTPSNNIQFSAQNSENATYCKKIKKEDLKLDLSEPAEVSLRKIKAYGPIPGAYIINAQGNRVKILTATLSENQLVPDIIVPEGKKKMRYTDYLLAHPEGL